MILGSSLHMKIQITENLGIPAPEGQNFFVLFSFHFQILHKKLKTFFFSHILFYKSDINEYKDVLFDFWWIKQDIKKWLK